MSKFFVALYILSSEDNILVHGYSFYSIYPACLSIYLSVSLRVHNPSFRYVLVLHALDLKPALRIKHLCEFLLLLLHHHPSEVDLTSVSILHVPDVLYHLVIVVDSNNHKANDY